MRRVAAVLLVVALVGGCSDDGEPAGRPARVLDLRPGSIERIDVLETATGRTGSGRPGARLTADLTPLLAVRELDRPRPEYGLDPPRLEVTIHAAGREVGLRVGADNFDGTAVYVLAGGRTALVLPRVVEALEALLGGQSESPQMAENRP
jgi:hypothetical protein